MSIEISIKRHHWSRRVKITVGRDGRVLVTMPKRASLSRVQAFINEKRAWIEERVERAKMRQGKDPLQLPPSTSSGQALGKGERHRLQVLIEPLVTRYCQMLGAECERISIRAQRSRWGSCSSKKTLSFNVRLALLPIELVEYVVVHEVCHLREMNHSPAFWKLVETAIPDYRKRRAALQRVDRV